MVGSIFKFFIGSLREFLDHCDVALVGKKSLLDKPNGQSDIHPAVFHDGSMCPTDFNVVVHSLYVHSEAVLQCGILFLLLVS